MVSQEEKAINRIKSLESWIKFNQDKTVNWFVSKMQYEHGVSEKTTLKYLSHLSFLGKIKCVSDENVNVFQSKYVAVEGS